MQTLSLFEEIIRLAKFNTQKTLKSGVCSSKSVSAGGFTFPNFSLLCFYLFCSLCLALHAERKVKGKRVSRGLRRKVTERSDHFHFHNKVAPFSREASRRCFFRACALLMDNILNGSAGSAVFTTFFCDDRNLRYLRYII